jgi:hypothetical protein
VAIFYPANPPERSPSSELRVRDALRGLDDRWRIFHQVVWQSRRNGREADGEADFVLLHPSGGLLVLEVKGGRVGIEDGDWYSIDRFDERRPDLRFCGADDGIRTRDPNLGKVVLYQLSHVRVGDENSARAAPAQVPASRATTGANCSYWSSPKTT